MLSQRHPDTLAAIDLGSNSFHMIIARVVREGQLQVLDRLREMVQLAAGLDEAGCLSETAQERALNCLARFGQRLRHLPPWAIRAVGTNTLRQANNADEFLKRASAALGHPIEVIAGDEEARLIYLGVSHALDFDNARRLVVDIGGGSTEFIIGEGAEEGRYRQSIEMGCVRYSRCFFPQGELNKAAMRQAEIAARTMLQDFEQSFRHLGWEEAIGASGTIRTVARVVAAQGWCGSGTITATSLKALVNRMIEAGHIKRLKFEGLSAERGPVFPGGVAVLKGIFESLGIERMMVSDGALREGLLYDLIGRICHEDVRDRTVADLAQRYHVDQFHACRVKNTALALLEAAASLWELEEEHALSLAWGAILHEAGLALSHSQYHKHGAYLLAYGDLPGFSQQEQQVLAFLVRGHRRKLPIAKLDLLPEDLRQPTLRLCLLLRLAVLLNRNRSPVVLPPLTFKAEKNTLKLRFPDGWLLQHPLTEADLVQEATYIKAAGYRLKIK
ncbi:Exopolyphosphatase [Nitrosococcus oceani ATCC 19707]|uniref:Exopolyphosphatase n=2 Tax=Nitrosococcus oceani TaxID=1229 RepID=Q3J8J4_NITOC|nr:exopolyphosphatase [Nitrosococcus oceani]ABA58852.1 Exopolyphosphatase [Nitrosococcus oceani ATCC 19707]EDZ68493.1 Ppx/GppA phosphatase family [Nitrosococcus oceani AFC27]KFI18653.1 exopolyphosphatase [Nitrosococcus oceani C-27]GEM19057.1 exopolyphosphatase [Nitrosococcus oceani]